MRDEGESADGEGAKQSLLTSVAVSVILQRKDQAWL